MEFLLVDGTIVKAHQLEISKNDYKEICEFISHQLGEKLQTKGVIGLPFMDRSLSLPGARDESTVNLYKKLLDWVKEPILDNLQNLRV